MRKTVQGSDKASVLFDGNLNPGLQVGIGHWNQDFYAYAKGYKDGADFIIQGVVNGSRNFNFQINELVFPIVFLYRQYLELRLKDIIVSSNRLNEKSPLLPPHLQNHEIRKLWKTAKPLIKAVSSSVSPEDLTAVEAIVERLYEVDAKGEAFRYPVDKKGRLHLPKLTAVNLGELKDTMQKVGEFLDGYSEYFTVLLQEKP